MLTQRTPHAIIQVPRNSDPAMVWKQLYSLSRPVVENFLSDWFHDAMWLDRHLSEAIEEDGGFWFGANPCGTHIGFPENIIREFSTHVWEIRFDYESDLELSKLRQKGGAA